VVCDTFGVDGSQAGVVVLLRLGYLLTAEPALDRDCVARPPCNHLLAVHFSDVADEPRGLLEVVRAKANKISPGYDTLTKWFRLPVKI